MRIFNSVASKTRAIIIGMLLASPLSYLLFEKDLEKAILVASAAYTPITTILTLYLIYRQIRLTVAIRLEQEHSEERLRRLDFAKYWYEKLRENFSTQEKIDIFECKLLIFLNKDNINTPEEFHEAIATDKDFLLVFQLYLILLQLNKNKQSHLDAQALVQVKGMAFHALCQKIIIDFEKATVRYGGGIYESTDDFVFKENSLYFKK